MRIRRFFFSRFAALLLGLLVGGLPAYAAATAGGGYFGHEVIAGDFNGDGWMDFIVQAVSAYFTNAEFIADSHGKYAEPAATWKAKHLGLDWNANAHKILTGDFNGDGRSDLFLQGAAGLGSAVLLAASDGQFKRIAEVPPRTLQGLTLSQASHNLIVGDFNGDGHDDLLLQAKSVMGTQGVALAGSDGGFRSLAGSWADGALGLHWSSDYVAVAAGNFTGSGRAELLLRSKVAADAGSECCRIVRLGKDFKPQKIVQSWTANYLGLDWSPADYRAIVTDLNGDGRDDLLLQPIQPSGEMYVLFADKTGQFKKLDAKWPAVHNGNDWSGASYRIAVERGTSGHSARLVFIPKQAGLSYLRVSLDNSGAVASVTTLPSPPPTLAAAGSSSGGYAAPLAEGAPNAVQSATSSANDAVGTVAGKFSVSSGSASYRIPIAVAPGVNGLHPNLAVVYNSRQGGSQLGLGWALSGLSAVTRCPATVATDGYAQAPNFTSADRFCLDNTHLYANSGTYGGGGTQYHTKPASFSRITSHGTQGNGPAWFDVWDKSGTIREYGHTTDSSIDAGSTFDHDTAIWLLDKITDRYGNFIRFTYQKDTPRTYGGPDQSYRLAEIDYGNNQGTVVGKLVFDYSPLGAYHTQLVYASGIAHLQQDDMADIKVYSAGSLIWTYKFDYNLAWRGRPILTSATQCAASGSCYPATRFTYSAPAIDYSTSRIRLVDGSNIANMHYGDVNGDGKTDLIYTDSDHNGDWCIYFSGPGTTTCTGIPKGVKPKSAIVLDANSDGYADLLVPASGGKWNLYESNGSTISSTPTQVLDYYSGDHPGIVPADVNGDGYPELFFHHNGQLWYYPNNAGTFGSAETTGYVLTAYQQIIPFRFTNAPALSLYIGTQGCDMTGWPPPGGGGDNPPGGGGGDPIANVQAAVRAVSDATGSTRCQASVGALTYNHATSAFDHYDAPWGGGVKFLDINGDGLADLFMRDSNGAAVYLNTGGAFDGPGGTPNNCTIVANSSADWQVADEDNDGRQDLLLPCNGKSDWYDLFWGGYDGSIVLLDWEQTHLVAHFDAPNTVVSSISYTGNGLGAIVYKQNGYWYVVEHNPPAVAGNGNLLTGITNGLGAHIAIQYGALSANPNLYTPDRGAGICGSGQNAAEVRPLSGPLWEVSQIQTQVASGITLTTNYHYEGAALDRAGRGFLGFADVSSTNNLGYKTVTDYCLNYPFTGMAKASKQWAPGNRLISASSDTVNTRSGMYANLFPYVSQIVADSWGLNGAKYEEAVTTKTYDNHGNTKTLKKVTTDWATKKTWTMSEANTYTDSTTNWCLGRLHTADVTYSRSGDPTSIVRNTGYTYATDKTCELETEDYSTSNAHDHWHKAYVYDSFGNIKQQTLTGWRLGTRTTKTGYDPNGRYATSKTDPLGWITTTAWNQAFGEKQEVTGPNGASVTYNYDGFGRLASTSGPHASEGASETYAWCSSDESNHVNCAASARAVYRLTKTQNGGPTGYTEYDEHGRKVLTATSQYGNRWAQQATYYDAFGRPYLTSAPYRPGTEPCWDFKKYDALNRVTAEYSAANDTECTVGMLAPGAGKPGAYSVATSMTYAGLTTTINANGHTSTVVKTVMGKVSSKTLPAGGSEHYSYDAAGDLTSKTDAAGVTETFKYDPAGHRTSRISPTSGTWTYIEDAKDELYYQKDPTGNTVYQYYDPAGHLIKRTIKDGASGTTHSVQWTYGGTGTQSPFNAGRLASVSNGKSGTDAFTKSYIYDAAGEVIQLTTTIDNVAYPLNKTYDDYGRLTQVQYPPSPAPAGADLPPAASASASPTRRTSAGTVTLDGSASSDPDHGPESLSYQWTQIAGPSVGISGATSAVAHVTLSKNGNYEFKLTVGDGYKSDTATVAVTVAIPPGGAGKPAVSPNPSQTGNYTVSWSSVANTTSYKLDEYHGSWSQIYSGTATHWSPSSPKPNGSYRYRIRNCNSAGCSAWSAQVTETVNQTPGAPSDLHRTYSAPIGGQPYTLKWTAPGYGAVTDYELEKSPNSSFSPAYTTTTSFPQHTETWGRYGAKHYYRVRACHNSYCGGWSNVLVVTDPGGGPGGPGQCPPHCINPRTAMPPGSGSTWRYTLNYSYDAASGALTKVVSADDPTHPYWTLTSVGVTGAVSGAYVNGTAIQVTHSTDRASGRITALEATGWATTVMDESYTYDVFGNRASRQEGLYGQSEGYSYDADNRLTNAQESRAGGVSTTFHADYDAAGNFKSRSGLGHYIDYSYKAKTGSGADKLASVTGDFTGSFGYDAAGRIVSGPDGLSATYNARGLATVLHKKGHVAQLIYAPNGQRYESILDSTTTEYYLAGGAFRILQKSGVATYREAVVVGGVVIAQLTTSSNATNSFHYFFHDALGSIVAIAGTSGTDNIQHLAYAPYGQMRQATNWQDIMLPPAIEALNLPTRRGYTGGEALTALGLVHLGARIYDPALGRWLSPDPAGASTPYVYVHDNPLSDTDPNGQLSIGQILTIAALVALTVVTYGALAPVLGAFLAAVCAGAVGGFARGMIASDGNIGAGLVGAVEGAAAGAAFAYLGGAGFYSSGFGGTMEKAGLEGFAGGALSDVEGGSFKDGFVGAFVGAVGGDAIMREIPGREQGQIMERTAAAAALGGTASKLCGGSFANGAISAAFQHLFNDEGHWAGLFRTNGRSPRQIEARAREQKVKENLKAINTCFRRVLRDEDTFVPIIQDADPLRIPMDWGLSDASLMHAYGETGLTAAEYGGETLSETSFVRTSGSMAARAARWSLPKMSIGAKIFSHFSIGWTAAGMAMDAVAIPYAEVRLATEPSLSAQCAWNP